MDRGFEKNEVLEKLPTHLQDFVIDQPYNEYTPQDHAVWRYVMRQNVNFLGKVAHQSYLEGLKKAGISIDTIPHMYGMNRILQEIGWAAVSVDGFIPPQAFMEFQEYNVLVIAADIRNIGNIQYTPAPDIIHEAAGHAPIIADAEYSHYLKRFGEIGSKAFSSKKDFELYEAIRHLSIIKENPGTIQKDIDDTEAHIAWLQQNMGERSEMAKIRNLHWWTVEYGLIGTVEDFRIYGAGLLSSIGESANCMLPKVKKLPYSIDAVDYSFDITTEQPQLFVTPSFQHLNEVLDEFAAEMAISKGGAYALNTAINSAALSTVVFKNGISISGVPVQGEAKEGYSQITFENRVGVFSQSNTLYIDSENQEEGLMLFIGVSKNEIGMNDSDFQWETFQNPSGILVELGTKPNAKRILVISGDGTLTSAFSGTDHPEEWNLHFDPPKEKTLKIIHSESAKQLHDLYKEVREIRETKNNTEKLPSIYNNVKANFSNDWLLPLEIYEITNKRNLFPELQEEIAAYLQVLGTTNASFEKLISDGLNLIKENVNLIQA